MYSLTAARSLFLGLLFFNVSQVYGATPPVTNDDCSGALTLTIGVAATNQTVKGATASAGIPVGCATGSPDDDVWYTFTLTSASNITITLSNIGSSLNSSGAMLQLFSGSCASLVSLACGNTELTTSLAGGTYFIRVYSWGSFPINNNANFDITVTGPPSNDNCPGAVALASGVTSQGTVWLATASSGVPVDCATGTPDDDVWYKITTSTFSNNLSVSLPAIGSNLSTSGARIQVLTGGCGSLTTVACGTTSVAAPVAGNTTYFIRVYSAGAGSIGGTSSGSAFSISATVTGPTVVTAGRMNEVFQQTILSDNGVLQYPWEVTYGPDNYLWITESRGYKVYRMDPGTGAKTTVLDLSTNSTWLPSPSDSLDAIGVTSQSNWNTTASKWPQGGLAGLAIHPRFLDGSGNDYVYVSYVHRYLSGSASVTTGMFFRNKLVRFTYNSGTGRLESPIVLCDTLPGSSDHNSQRMIIAKVTADSLYYLYYAQGDMGAGQFENRDRPNKAQNPASYEGKILRFNLVSDGDPGADAWIPNTNPYNASLGVQSAVYSIGIRNNQGFACDTAKHILYGASHGPYSDDEINIIESGRNYGHPLVEGFAADGNVNNTTAGAPLSNNNGVSTCPMITNESANAAAIGASYKDPLFSAYPNSTAFPSIYNLWTTTTGANAQWPTEAWSGLDLYQGTLIPAWKRSLVAASLKWGRLVRLKLDSSGAAIAPTNTVSDTVTYFNSQNRFRDLAFSPGGKDIFVIMDNSSTTSGPGSANPVVPACAGCLHKYTFLGYMPDANGKSTIPASIDVASGTANACQTGTTITIDSTNYNIWVPVTGQDGNIVAEIKANGNKLGTVTTSFYTNTGAVRENGQKKLYSNRNITITPQNQPSSPVNIRLYMTAAEFNSLKTATNSVGAVSGINTINDVAILKNQDPCGASMVNTTLTVTPQYAEAFGSNYVLQGTISSFSSFYLANSNSGTLPLQLLTFTGSLQDNSIAYLQWETANEVNVARFELERSSDGSHFITVGNIAASDNTREKNDYTFSDKNAGLQQAAILYYRLKMVDRNGAYSTSRIINLVLNNNINGLLFPNPARQTLNLQLKTKIPGPVWIQVSDLTGRILYSQKRNMAQATLSTIDVKQWKPQVYILKLTNSKNEVIKTERFEKI